MHLPWDPTQRSLGQENLVPGTGNVVSPYFVGVFRVIGLPQFQGLKGVLGCKPENMTKTG